MNKIGIITDSHYGARGDNDVFLDNNKRFVDEILLPTLEKENITTLFHLGDLVDKRRQIAFKTAHRLKTDFIEPLQRRGIDFHLILGNHDVPYKKSNMMSGPEMMFDDARGIHIYNGPSEVVACGHKVMLVPWICEENREQTIEAIKQSQAKVCFGHLELSGYQMYKGVMASHGDDRKLFEKFDLVCTGHYHHKSDDGRIHYLGAHGQFTWSDYNDLRGFHLLDLDGLGLEFIPNPYEMFIKVGYDDADGKPVMWDLADSDRGVDVTGKYVKVVVTTKLHPAKFDKFITLLEDQNPIDVQVIDQAFNVDVVEGEEIDQSEDTLTIFRKYINEMDEMDVPKESLEKLFINLYQEASEVR